MRFYFDIDDETFNDDYGVGFAEIVKQEAIQTIAQTVIYHATGNNYNSEFNAIIKQIIKEKTPEIIDRVVEKVAGQIARKKELVEMTPKVSELAAIDKENVAYFEEMIDKAIARRFGKSKN